MTVGNRALSVTWFSAAITRGACEAEASVWEVQGVERGGQQRAERGRKERYDIRVVVGVNKFYRASDSINGGASTRRRVTARGRPNTTHSEIQKCNASLLLFTKPTDSFHCSDVEGTPEPHGGPAGP